MKLILCIAFISVSSFAASQLKNIEVTGDKEALLTFSGVNQKPEFNVNANVIEIQFKGTTLDPHYQGKVDMASPHTLVKRISAFQSDKETVRVNLILNGSLEKIKDRMKVESAADGIALRVNYLDSEVNLVDTLKEEQIPLGVAAKGKTEKAEKNGVLGIIFSVISLIAFGVIAFFSVRFLKTKGGFKGTRKYLVEQLGYCSYGPKMGVSLLKVGGEFVLVGVTPNQISLLSTLPKLQAQYLDESSFERTSFNAAVKEEMQKNGRTQ